MYETYERKVAKIEAGQTSKLAATTLQWITSAVRPLSLGEIQEAVAFDQDDTCWNVDKLPHPDKIIGSCQNLVILHEDGKLSFAHHTVRSFLLSRRSRTWRSSLSFDLEAANMRAAMVCVTYLCFTDFEAQIAHRPQEVVQPIGAIDSGGLFHLARSLGVSDLLFSLPYKLLGGSPRQLSNPIEVKWTRSSPKSAVAPILIEKYKLLDYAIRYWLLHTKDLPPKDREVGHYRKGNHHEESFDSLQYLDCKYATWARFSKLALERVMTFDHLSWASESNHKDLPFDAMFRWALENAHVPLLTLLEVPSRGPPLIVYLERHLLNGQDVLRIPCVRGEIRVLEYLVQYCHENKVELRKFLNIDEYLSWCASFNGHTSVVELLLREGANAKAKTEHPHYAPNIDGFPSATALQLAVLNGHHEVVDVLLAHGAFIDEWNFHGLQPLHYAPNTETVGLLLRNGADINVKARNMTILSHLEYQMLPARTAAGETRLISAAAEGCLDLVQLLCERGASTDAVDPRGQTALHRACISGHVETVRILVAQTRQQINSKDDTSMTPLDQAIASRHPDVAYILLQAGAASPQLDFAELHKAAERGDTKMVNLLLDLGAPVDLYNKEGKTALQCAVEYEMVSVVQLLIERQATVDMSSSPIMCPYRTTPLITASASGHEGIVNMLLKAGAHCDLQDSDGRTALFCAVEMYHYEIARLLIAHEADPTTFAVLRAGSVFGWLPEWKTPLKILEDRKEDTDREMFEILKSYIAE